MNTSKTRMAAVAAIMAACGVGTLTGGCSSDGSRDEPALVVRPLVSSTAVEASMRGNGASAGFFDALESLPLASQDDAIHACLLLGTGTSAPSYEQRVAMATHLGYVPEGYDRPARQAVTMGEVAGMVARILEGRRSETEEEALAKLVHREIAPASVRVNQGLTGAQLVSITGGVRDAMALEGVGRMAPPIVAGGTKPPAQIAGSDEPTVRVASLPVKPGAPHAESGEGVSNGAPGPMQAGMPASNVPPALGGKGRVEPLPQIPAGKPAPAIELNDPSSRPSVIGPDDKVITPGQPKKPDAPRVETIKPAPKPVEPKPEVKVNDAPPVVAPKIVQPKREEVAREEPKPKKEAPKKEEPKPEEPKKEEVKKEEPKPKPKIDWVTGQPLKKPTEPK
jgi:hypothetical protein